MIAGGGFAALEAALALKALAANRVALTIVAPDPVLRYRPAATAEAFTEVPARGYDLRMIASDLGAAYQEDILTSVASEERRVTTGSGAQLGYDALILATGARIVVGVPGALNFRDQRDLSWFRRLLAELDRGAISRLVFVVPTGSSWPLPAYELALLSATRTQMRDLDTEILLVTPEPRPLAIFGSEASRLVGGLLAERGVSFAGGTAAASVLDDGSLALAVGGAAIQADRVVAVSQLRGRRICGVPASWWGFVPTEICGRVQGLTDVYAAGDMTAFPIKHGGLATQQADRIAQTIAADLGAPVKELRADHVLRARLLSGTHPIFLRAELDSYGAPTAATLERAERALPEASTKVFARYLTPYLEQLEPMRAPKRGVAAGCALST